MSKGVEMRLDCGAVVLVDADMYHQLAKCKWGINRMGYVRWHTRVGTVRQVTVLMHRVVIGAKPGEIVDHINGNPADNRRENLRIATARENQMNAKKGSFQGATSKFKGVGWEKRNGKWRARIVLNKKHMYLGLFDSEQEAAHAYNKAAMLHFGEFACLNPVGEEK